MRSISTGREFHKVIISKITRRFDLEAEVELGNGFYQGQTMALRGLDFPGYRSKKGQTLLRYLVKTSRSVPFLVVKRYGKDAFVRHSVDVFYLPGEKNSAQVAAAGRCLNKELPDEGHAVRMD